VSYKKKTKNKNRSSEPTTSNVTSDTLVTPTSNVKPFTYRIKPTSNVKSTPRVTPTSNLKSTHRVTPTSNLKSTHRVTPTSNLKSTHRVNSRNKTANVEFPRNTDTVSADRRAIGRTLRNTDFNPKSIHPKVENAYMKGGDGTIHIRNIKFSRGTSLAEANEATASLFAYLTKIVESSTQIITTELEEKKRIYKEKNKRTYKEDNKRTYKDNKKTYGDNRKGHQSYGSSSRRPACIGDFLSF
tara:strand:+ start:1924 stop:2649 length:726 start_codon:yes stop_codon:yes gene_type:complete